MEYTKTRNILKPRIRESLLKGIYMYTVDSITRNLATDSNLMLTRSNTNICFSSDHFYIILPLINSKHVLSA